MVMKRLTLFINRFLHLFEMKRIKNRSKSVYLTFDDGPEPGITEFVLDELKKYDFRATFFCRGDNAVSYKELLERIVIEGHALGNHTYSHYNSFDVTSKKYIEDVNRADIMLHSRLFRPPKGSLTLSSFMRLFRKYKIVYWSLLSGDAELDLFDRDKYSKHLINNTRSGDIVLFHFCHRHENETRMLLPSYLHWLYINGYHSEIIK